MHPDVVVDVGNTRIKWGWGAPGEPLRMASLPPDAPAAWDDQLALLPAATGPRTWAMAGVHPDRLTRLKDWAEARGDTVRVITHADIRIPIDVDEPARVGIDRLLNAVAARARVPAPRPVVVIDAGSAVTVDLVDAAGVFRGGAILPGPRLMARALHHYTAKLPDLPIDAVPSVDPPGRNTRDAIGTGIMAAIMGGCQLLVDEYRALSQSPVTVLMTGGAIGYLVDYDYAPDDEVGGPFPLTLEGVRLAAEALS
ncbi:MAG TPA: type III pantothenate kinase [Urbifossiella sp.]|nr:type III pantothenate kinase [Urbifossiella sp.]